MLIVQHITPGFLPGMVRWLGKEIALSVKEQKPTLIWLDGELNKHNVNPWIFAQVPPEYIFESWPELLDYLVEIDTSENHPEDRRWMLFRFEKIYNRVLSKTK